MYENEPELVLSGEQDWSFDDRTPPIGPLPPVHHYQSPIKQLKTLLGECDADDFDVELAHIGGCTADWMSGPATQTAATKTATTTTPDATLHPLVDSDSDAASTVAETQTPAATPPSAPTPRTLVILARPTSSRKRLFNEDTPSDGTTTAASKAKKQHISEINIQTRVDAIPDWFIRPTVPNDHRKRRIFFFASNLRLWSDTATAFHPRFFTQDELGWVLTTMVLAQQASMPWPEFLLQRCDEMHQNGWTEEHLEFMFASHLRRLRARHSRQAWYPADDAIIIYEMIRTHWFSTPAHVFPSEKDVRVCMSHIRRSRQITASTETMHVANLPLMQRCWNLKQLVFACFLHGPLSTPTNDGRQSMSSVPCAGSSVMSYQSLLAVYACMMQYTGDKTTMTAEQVWLRIAEQMHEPAASPSDSTGAASETTKSTAASLFFYTVVQMHTRILLRLIQTFDLMDITALTIAFERFMRLILSDLAHVDISPCFGDEEQVPWDVCLVASTPPESQPSLTEINMALKTVHQLLRKNKWHDDYMHLPFSRREPTLATALIHSLLHGLVARVLHALMKGGRGDAAPL
jgi:hypothetical protein